MNIKISKITANILLSVLPCTAFCQDKIDFSKCKPTLPDPKHFCADIITLDPYSGEDSLYDFKFQKVMYESACADIESMSDKEISQKLREWWNLYKDKLVCGEGAFQFGLLNKNVLKAAVRNNVKSFVDEAIYAGFDLNVIDQSDGGTVLDYIKDRQKILKGTPLEKELQMYYDKLRKAGAKHKSEL